MELIKNDAPATGETEKPHAPQVNDVAAPTAAETPKTPDDANVAPAPQSDTPESELASSTQPASDQPKAVKPPKVPRQRGAGGAIFAAVVIVLALGAMFTYAYLRSNNISLF